MTYFVLAARETAEAPYHVAFGDYDRATVKDEMADLADSFAYSNGGYRRSNMKIIKAARATKKAVDAAMTELNAAIGSRANVAETVGAERGPLATATTTAATVCPINAHLAANRSDRGGFWSIAPPLVFANGATLSVQGSESHYCEPRANHGPYTAVEVGPADHRLFPELRGHRCQGGRTEVHGWVPVTVILAIVARIGLKTS